MDPPLLAVGEAYTKPCSRRCKFLLKKLRIQMEDVPEPPRSQHASLPDLQAVFENTYFMGFFRFQKNMTFYVFLK